MMNPSMRVISATGPNNQKFCKIPRQIARECEGKANANPTDGNNCNSHREVAKKCERVVRKAFRNINMGGCPKQIKLLTLCEDEWCYHDRMSCQKECAGVRKNLLVCVQETVELYFKRNGFEKDGTVG